MWYLSGPGDVRPTVPEIDIDQLELAVSAGATVIDVRERSEYVGGHVPGAALLPMSEHGCGLDAIDRRRPVYVVCASGHRSAAMTEVLVAAGFDASSVAGGTDAWERSGRPLAHDVRTVC